MFWVFFLIFLFVIFRVGASKSVGRYDSKGSKSSVSLTDKPNELIKMDEDRINEIRRELKTIREERLRLENRKNIIDVLSSFDGLDEDILNLLPSDYSLCNRSREIKNIVRSRGIEKLVHFTDLQNLKSILENGIIPRASLENDFSSFIYNDSLRLDGRSNTSSLSITLPNWKMFYKYRVSSKRKWVVLLLDVSLLWESDCLFCYHNAADSRIANLSDEELSKPDYLKKMFINYNGFARDNLKDYDTTDPQAEVLVKGDIPVCKIKSIVFERPEDVLKFNRNLYSYPDNINVFSDKSFYSNRDFVRNGNGLWH